MDAELVAEGQSFLDLSAAGLELAEYRRSCDSVLAIRRARTARSYTFDFAALSIEALSIPFHVGTILTSAADGGHQAEEWAKAPAPHPPKTLH